MNTIKVIETLRSEIHEMLNSAVNKEELTEQRTESIIVLV
jgi:hypothetical protein